MVCFKTDPKLYGLSLTVVWWGLQDESLVKCVLKAMIGQGGTNVTFFEFKKEDNEYEITWSKNEPKFAELNLGSVLRLQPFQDKLVEDESRTLLHCKGALGHNISNLKVLYTLSTKPEKYVDSTEPYFRNITIAHTIGALKSDITKPR